MLIILAISCVILYNSKSFSFNKGFEPHYILPFDQEFVARFCVKDSQWEFWDVKKDCDHLGGPMKANPYPLVLPRISQMGITNDVSFQSAQTSDDSSEAGANSTKSWWVVPKLFF